MVFYSPPLQYCKKLGRVEGTVKLKLHDESDPLYWKPRELVKGCTCKTKSCVKCGCGCLSPSCPTYEITCQCKAWGITLPSTLTPTYCTTLCHDVKQKIPLSKKICF